MTDKMKDVPIYTSTYDNTIPRDEVLDTLTYDIILGEKYLDGHSDETDTD